MTIGRGQDTDRLSLALDSIKSAAALLDRSGRITAVNRRWAAEAVAAGADPSTVGPGASYLAVCDEAVGPFRHGATEAAAGIRAVLDGKAALFSLDYPCSSGTMEQWFSMRVTPQPEIGGVLVTHLDVTELKLGELRFEVPMAQWAAALSDEHLAAATTETEETAQLGRDGPFGEFRDSLTRLPDRHLFMDCLDSILAARHETGRSSALLAIDLDDFEWVNDRLGHSGGDEILRKVAVGIAGVLREGDTIGRLGGNEFAVYCRGLADAAEACVVADRVMEAIKATGVAHGERLNLAASIGICLAEGGSRAGELLRDAEMALSRAKDAGKGRVEVFEEAWLHQTRRHHELAVDLREALDRGEVETVFEPRVMLRTGKLIGFEAQARWTHPLRGPIEPAEFIAVAEAAGLIGRLGQGVLADGCAALGSWLDAVPEDRLQLGISISSEQLLDPLFPQTVREMVERARIPAGLVCLAVTESSLGDPELAGAAIRRLKSTGVAIAIDDFRAGYTSLNRLYRFPADFVKIQSSFVAAMGDQSEDCVIVGAMLGLARALGLKTIAAGVAKAAQLEQLAGAGCDAGQGELWHPAMSAAEALALALSDEPLRHCETAVADVAVAAPFWENDTDGNNASAAALAVLAHELASPVTVLAGHAEMLAALDTSELREHYAHTIRTAAGVVRTSLNLLVDVAAIDAGAIALHRSPVRISDIVAEAVLLVECPPDTTIEIRVAESIVYGDAKRLVGVLVNLLSNAFKHARHSGVIRVIGEETGAFAVVHVVDNGPGVALDKIGTIFRRFGRADHSIPGSGLGLYVARGVARAHGGDLSYHRAETGGADFALELPLLWGISAPRPRPARVVRPRRTVGLTSVTPLPLTPFPVANHGFKIYTGEDAMFTSVVDAFEAACRKGEATIAFAPEDHCWTIDNRLRSRGVELDHNAHHSIDSETTLDVLLVDGELDRDRFHHTVGSLVKALGDAYSRVTIYDEMAGSFWSRRQIVSAMKLERLWAELGTEPTCTLLSGYRGSIPA